MYNNNLHIQYLARVCTRGQTDVVDELARGVESLTAVTKEAGSVGPLVEDHYLHLDYSWRWRGERGKEEGELGGGEGEEVTRRRLGKLGGSE